MEHSPRSLTTGNGSFPTANDIKAVSYTHLLTGGEPLLFPGFKELYIELQKMGMILTINTNGTLIDEEWADFFQKYKPRRMNITLYGADDQAYEQLCHYPGGFQKTCLLYTSE